MRCILVALVVGCVSPDSNATQDWLEPEPAPQIAACSVNVWCKETAPIAGALRLSAIWAVQAGDVFAVGDNGTILRRTNEVWTAMASGTTTNLLGVWASSSSDVWATGGSGTILHYDGTAWSPFASGVTADLEAVWGSRATDVWFVGGTVILHWNGTRFSSTSVTGTLLAVSGTGPSDVWATGENTNLRHFDGVNWTPINLGADLRAQLTVLAIAPNDVWVSSSVRTKETVHWNGTTWVPQLASVTNFNAMSAVASNDVWGVGNLVGHWDGKVWSTDKPFATVMWSVTTVPHHAWLVGNAALIGHRTF